MPTYDYLCSACGHKWELFQRITEDPVKKCPGCNKRKAVRQFGTGAAVVFKGSGFYETDYRSESYKKSAAAETKSNDSGSSKDAKSDTSTKSDSGSSSKKSSGDTGSKPGKSD